MKLSDANRISEEDEKMEEEKAEQKNKSKRRGRRRYKMGMRKRRGEEVQGQIFFLLIF